MGRGWYNFIQDIKEKGVQDLRHDVHYLENAQDLEEENLHDLEDMPYLKEDDVCNFQGEKEQNF